MIECKYHNAEGRVCNVKIPLYIHSRFLDIEKQWIRRKSHKTKHHKGGVYTNTRFTSDAIQYGKCVGLLMTSWDYPEGKDRKSTRLNSSHVANSYAVFCLKKKTIDKK